MYRMKMFRTKALLGLMLAGFMGSAAAVGPSYLGDLVGKTFDIGNTIGGNGISFADSYDFDIGSFTAETFATAVQVTLKYTIGTTTTTAYDISNFAIELKDVNNIQYAFDNIFNNGVLELSATLAPSDIGSPGFYQFVVSGTTAGSSGGIYAGALTAQPIPEADAYAMMLAGLGLIGMMVRSRGRYRM